jgi:GntR family transcriptional regulator
MPSPTAPVDPKHVRVRAQLVRTVESMPAGAALAPERDLAASLGVARMTLRKALDSLVAEGLVVRRQGQGTFVAPTGVPQRLAARSFTEDMRSRGLRPGSLTLESGVRHAGVVIAACLDVAPNTQVLHVRRLRLADEEPMAIEDLYVPRDLVPGLDGADLEGASFYDLLDQRYGQRISGGTQTAEPILAAAGDAAVLGIPPGAPCFLFERTSRVSTGEVMEFVRSVYRGDRYRIVVDLLPPRDPSAAQGSAGPKAR